MATWIARRAGEAVAAFRAAAAPQDNTSRAMQAQWTDWERERGVPAPREERSDSARYATSADVYRAVALLAENGANVPLVAHVDGEPEPDHELSLLLAHGNPDEGGLGLWVNVYSRLLCTGECAVTIRRDNPLNRALPNALQAWGGASWRVYPGADGWIDHYRYVPRGRTEAEGIRFDRDEVLWLRTWNPDNPLRGLSPLSSLRLTLDAQLGAELSNRNIFEHGYQLAGVMTLPNATNEQVERFKSDWRRRGQGPQHAHEILFTGADSVDIERLSLTPKDMEFLELRKATTSDVARVYGIPEPFLGLLDHATLQNMDVLHGSLWTEAILPRVQWLCGLLNQQLVPQYPDAERLTIEPDLDGVDALDDIRRGNEQTEAQTEASRAEAYSKLIVAGVNPEQAGALLFGERMEPSAFGKPPSAQSQPQPPAAKSYPAAPAGRFTLSAKALGADLRAARAALVPAGEVAIATAFDQQRTIALGTLARRWGTRDFADDLTGDIMAEIGLDSSMDDALRGFCAESAETGVRVYADVYGLGAHVDQVVAATLRWAETTAAHRVVLISRDTEQLLRTGITEAIQTGAGYDGVRDAVERAFRSSAESEAEHLYVGRVDNIVSTELNRAYNHGGVAAMLDSGAQYRKWVYSGIPDSRHGPHPPNGVVLPFGTPFTMPNGEQAEYPSADTLGPGQSCRCMCITVRATADEYQAQAGA